MKPNYGDVTVSVLDNFVAICEINRAPNNFFDQALIADLADAFEAIDQNPATRAIVLCSEGKHFCAGANFGSSERRQTTDASTPLTPTHSTLRRFDCFVQKRL